jgi:hypothetical protein
LRAQAKTKIKRDKRSVEDLVMTATANTTGIGEEGRRRKKRRKRMGVMGMKKMKEMKRRKRRMTKRTKKACLVVASGKR